MAVEKIKILGAVLELPAKQHCQLCQFGQFARRSDRQGNLFLISSLSRYQICRNFYSFMQPFHYYNKIGIFCKKNIAFDEQML